MCITYIYILSHSHLHHVYYFYHVNSSEHNNYNLFSIFEIIKQKKPQNRTNMLFGSINIVKIIFFYLRDCDTSLSDCIECIHPV